MGKLTIEMKGFEPKQLRMKQLITDIENLVHGINRYRGGGITHIRFERKSSPEHLYIRATLKAGEVQLMINLRPMKWWIENVHSIRVREFIVKSCRWMRTHMVYQYKRDSTLTVYSTRSRCPYTLD